MVESPKKSLTLSSRFSEINRVENFVNILQDWVKFNDKLYSNIMLALSEAVTNAILHGNKEDPEKKVYIIATSQEDELKITVEDEGDGFDPSGLPDPLKEENLLKDSGRGVYLIGKYADKVKYSKDGKKITICFSL